MHCREQVSSRERWAEICRTFSRESPMSCFPLGNELATNDENGGGQPSVVGGLFSEERSRMNLCYGVVRQDCFCRRIWFENRARITQGLPLGLGLDAFVSFPENTH